jgi:hypothetical protein
MGLKEKYRKIAQEIEDSYLDKFLHIDTKEETKHLYIDKAINILNLLTEKDWKLNKFDLISFFIGVQLNGENRKILFDEEKENCIKNLYDISYIKKENYYKFRNTVKTFLKTFTEKGFLVMGDCELISKDGETLQIPLIFDINQLFLNVTIDKNRIKNIYQTLYKFAIERKNKEMFPSEALPELFLNDKWKKNLNYYIEESAVKYISFIKEHKNLFADKENSFIIKNTYNYILSSNIEVIEGKHHLYFKMGKNLPDNFFEYISTDEIFNRNFFKYINEKYKNSDLLKKIEEIQKFLNKNKSSKKENKKIVLLNKTDFYNGKKIITGLLKLPEQENIVQRYKNIKNFSYSSFKTYNRIKKSLNKRKKLDIDRF